MTLDFANFDELSANAVRHFWAGRGALKGEDERAQGGERDAVLGGRNLDGFLPFLCDLVQRNGLPAATIHTSSRALLTLPGYYRPTKMWDVLVMDGGQLVAAIELKSQVGPSFGNNFNNRTEEAIGTAHDLWTAYREGALGAQQRPFVGWLMLVEDCSKSRAPVRDTSLHFDVFPEFASASYLGRYDILCRRLMQEKLYTQAAVMTSERSAYADGRFGRMSDATSLEAFAAGLAGHVASWAATAKLTGATKLL